MKPHRPWMGDDSIQQNNISCGAFQGKIQIEKQNHNNKSTSNDPNQGRSDFLGDMDESDEDPRIEIQKDLE